MPIEQSRVEAAARAMHPWRWESLPGHSDEECAECKASRDLARRDAELALAAAFPELASDPPKAWVAPVKATEAIGHAVWAAMQADCDPMETARHAHLEEQAP